MLTDIRFLAWKAYRGGMEINRRKAQGENDDRIVMKFFGFSFFGWA